MQKTFTGSLATTFVKKQIGKKINNVVDGFKEGCQVIKDGLQATIDINGLKRLHKAGGICNSEYTEELDQQLNIPDQVKVAWRNFSEARRTYEEVLSQHGIEL
jgi:hypothetical protein